MRFANRIFTSSRSPIISRRGMVATSQPLAAQAGLAVLQAGGNAIDAAIATVATLCVVEPCSTGIGGDAFGLIWSADEGRLYGINASGPAPAAMEAGWLRKLGHNSFPTHGGLSVTVPGSLRGWELALSRFGSRGLDSLLSQAIDYAQNGYPVSPYIGRSWARSTDLLSRLPDSRRVWLPSGRAPQVAEIFANHEFATTLRTIADHGPDVFYRGSIGQQIVQSIRADGGVMAESDLANYQAEWVEPIAIDYLDGFTFHEIPPNGQGLTALIALNLVKDMGLRHMEYGSADYYHLLIEAMKLAFADAETYIGDPRQADIPVEDLLSDRYTRQRRSLIAPDRALYPEPGRPGTHGDTVYLTVADEAGNMVSWIQSLYMGFGSGLTAGKTGVQLQNRGANFSLQPGHPNEAAPGKRPYHTIIPGFISRHRQPWSSFGVMGGFMQPQGHLQVGVNLVDFEMDPQTALDAPRFNWLRGREVALERVIGEKTRSDLARRGHALLPADADVHYGGGQVIVRDPESGVLIGGSEPRNDGAAVGF
jgi:gamma-glutamyltranspeptidase / glutathione hydrolase